MLEGAEYWACVRVETGGLEWVVVTACQLRRQQSRGPACYRVFRECLRELGPVRRAHRCTAEDIPLAPAAFVEVTRPPKVQGQDVWLVAPSNMWQAEHAAVMCRALQGLGGGPPQGTGGAVLQQQASSLAGAAAQCVAGVVLGRSGAGTPLIGSAPVRSRGGHGAHGPPRRPGGPAPWCSEWRRRHGAVPPRHCGRLGRDALPPAERRRCPPPGLGGEPGAVAPGVLHVQVEGRGRPGEVRLRLAPLDGGAVSRGGDAAPAATTRRAAGAACGTPGRCGEAGSEGSAQAATQEEPPTSVWQLCQHSVRAAALRRRPGHGAAWIEGDQRLPLVSTGWSWPLHVESRQALPARPPPPQGPAGPPSPGPWGRSSSTGPGDSHAGRHYATRPRGAFRIGPG